MIRQHIRFPPDALSVAHLDLSQDLSAFNPTLVGLIENESYTGCALIIYSATVPLMEQSLRIQVGSIGPLKGKFVWLKELDPKIYKVGIQYQE